MPSGPTGVRPAGGSSPATRSPVSARSCAPPRSPQPHPRRTVRLIDRPARTGTEQRSHVAQPALALRLRDLLGHLRPVLGALDGPEDTDRGRLVGTAGEAGQREGEAGVVPLLVVDEQGVEPHFGGGGG